MKLHKSSRGFTLLESIMYLALFTIIIGGSMLAVHQILAASEAAYNHIVLQEEANFLSRKISWALTGATAVSIPAPPSTLTVTHPVHGSLAFSPNSNELMLQRSSNPPVTLNSESVRITSLSFDIVSEAGKPDAIVTTFMLYTFQSGREANQLFSFTKYLR